MEFLFKCEFRGQGVVGLSQSEVEDLSRDQVSLAALADREEPHAMVHSFVTLGGCSQVSGPGGIICSAVVTLDPENMQIRASSLARVSTDMEYVPTYLAYREGPALMKALDAIKVRPDLLMVPASGEAHPRGIGMARHIGYIASIPTVGVTRHPLRFRGGGDQVTLSPGPGRGRVYVTRGWAIGIDTAVDVVRRSIRDHRVPEPLHIARSIARERAATA